MSGKLIRLPKPRQPRKRGVLGPPEASAIMVEQARDLLARATTVAEVKEIADVAATMAFHTRRRDAASDAHAHAYEIKQRAHRRLGELTRALEQAKAGRPKKIGNTELQIPKTQALKQAGISRMQASRYESIAAIPDAEFEKRLELGKARIKADKPPANIDVPSSGSEYDGDEYGTPAEPYVQLVHEVLGGPPELDPASNAAANNIVRAERFFTKQDSGIGRSWKARTLFLNSPFSDELVAAFQAQFVAEYVGGQFGAGISLVNSSTETGWYQGLVEGTAAFCLVDHRIHFLQAGVPIKQNRYAQTFFYVGPDVPLFARVFSRVGQVVVRYEVPPSS